MADSEVSNNRIEAKFQQAMALHKQGRLDDAEIIYRSVLAHDASHFGAMHMLGVLHHQKGQHAVALELIESAISTDPHSAAAHSNRGLVLQALQRAEEALGSYNRALQLNLGNAQAHFNRGNVLRILKRPDEAVASFDAALQLKPDYAEAHLNRGNALRDLSRLNEALACYERALELKPDYAQAHLQRGNVLWKLNRPGEALASYDRALELRADSTDALNNRGNILLTLKRPAEALASYNRALQIKPDFADAHMNRGNALLDLKRPADALASFDHAVRLRVDHADAYMNRGNALAALKRPDEALASYEAALRLKPDYAEALNGCGAVLQEFRRLGEALASYERALQLNSDYTEAYVNRGNVLRELKRPEEALASYDRALQLKPDLPDALNNRGNALRDLRCFGELAKSYARLLAIDPDYDYALGYMFHAQLHGCDWSDYETIAAYIVSEVEQGKKREVPFAFLVHCNDPVAQLKCAGLYAADKWPVPQQALWCGERYRHDKIRIAYLSADFHAHATAYLAAELFETHDRSRFETFALSFGPEDNGDMRGRLRRSFDHFLDVRARSDREIARLLRGHEIDIAVDLKGFTADSRTGIFSFRGSPLQVSFLGFPGTMGVDYIDYIIADPHVIPAGHERFYSEKVIRLPDTYQANDRKRRIAERTPVRSELQLPEDGFVFCCFNNNYKITPPIFDIWMHLLKRVQGSALWLLEDNPDASRNLAREAERRGVSANRLIFAPRIEPDAHLARQRCADLFLDTLPCNAHTTASDALWAGLPLVTCTGNTFAGRVGGSLLHAVGLPELIAEDLVDYERLALELAVTPDMLAAIRAKLARNRSTRPLFDSDRFRRHIEDAYARMYECHQRGEPPIGFDVKPIEV